MLITNGIVKFFPSLFKQRWAMLAPGLWGNAQLVQALKIGVVFSGRQAPGSHNVIYKKKKFLVSPNFTILIVLSEFNGLNFVYGLQITCTIRGGSVEIIKCKYIILTPKYIYLYTNQVNF